MYRHLPTIAQDLAVSAKGLSLKMARYGDIYRKSYTGYIERQSWSEDRVLEFQQEKLLSVLQRACNSRRYRALYKQLGIDPRQISTAAWGHLPITYKRTLQDDIDSYRCRPPQRADKLIKTSGTTGTSLSLPVSCNVEPDQWAVWWRYRGWHGLSRGQKCALFASSPVVFGELQGRPYRFDFANNELRFSIFHISPKSARHYTRALNKHKPSWVHGNPTAIALLAHHMNECGLRLTYKVNLITVGSENLQPWQKTSIELAFGTSPVQHYGLVEAVANFSECEFGSLHVDEDFSYVEFIPA